MKKLLLIAAILIPSYTFADVTTGTVLVIDKVAPKNGAFTGLVNAENVDISTNAFNGNLGTGDTDLQTALETIDDLSVGGGSGVTVYPATATASFPFGLSASTMTLTGLPGEGVMYIDSNGTVSTTTVSGTGDIEGVSVTAPVTGGGTSGTVTIGLHQISLSTGVTGELPDGNLSSNVPLLNSTQTFTGTNNFTGEVTMSSATTMTASTMTYTDVHVVIVGTLTVNGVDVSGGAGAGTIEEITVTDPVVGGGTSGTVNIALNAINLSTGVTGTLADGSLSSNVPLLNSTQTFTGENTFDGATTFNSGVTQAASTTTLTDVHLVLIGESGFMVGTSTNGDATLARVTILDTDENLDKPIMRHYAIDAPWTGDVSVYQFYNGPSTSAASLQGEMIFRNVGSGSGVNGRSVGFKFLDGSGGELFSLGSDSSNVGGPYIPGGRIMRWFDSDSSNFVGFRSSATVATSVDWTLPNADGSSGQALVTDGNGNLSFDTVGGGSGTQSKSFTISAVDADGDFGAIWKVPAAITITRVNVVQVGATNVVGQLQECDSDGASCAAVDSSDITATTGNAADDGTLSNPSIDANDWIGWTTTSVSGTNTRLSVTFDYTVN